LGDEEGRTMKKCSVSILGFVLVGCVLSVDPIVPESESAFDDRLLGIWKEVDGQEYARVARYESDVYSIEYVDIEGSAGTFRARAGRLGKRFILDVWPDPEVLTGSDAYTGSLIPGHSLLVLEVAQDVVGTAVLDEEKLQAALDAGELRLPSLRPYELAILTGTTDQVREALAEYLERPGALQDIVYWRRTAEFPPVKTAPSHDAANPCFEVSVWPEADALFRRDPSWVGSDGAYSIDLGNQRTLWLFGDTWIDRTGGHQRAGAEMIRNSVAIQTGGDPSTATIAFHWRNAADGKAASFFPERGEQWFWPGHGIRIGDSLVLFLMRERSTDSGLGFEADGWSAVLVSNPDAAPTDWKMEWLDAPNNPLGVVIGSASVIRHGEHVYAFGSQETVNSHPMYVARWPVAELERGNLKSLQWWAGRDAGWVEDASMRPRHPSFLNGQSELTVHFDPTSERYLAVQTVGFGPADVALRSAAELTGPWTDPSLVYRPPEYYRPDIMIYAAKAHPQLEGADLVVTYATNLSDFSAQIADDSIYYPRFVRLWRCQ